MLKSDPSSKIQTRRDDGGAQRPISQTIHKSMPQPVGAPSQPYRITVAPTQSRDWAGRLILGLAFLGFITGCATEQVATTADQTFEQAPKPVRPVQPVQEERVSEPLAALPSPPAPPPPEPAPQPERRPQVADQPSPVAPAPPEPVPATTLFFFDIPFAFDRFTLGRAASPLVEVNAKRLKEYQANEWRLLLEGRCDEVGSVDYNLVLGERRAQTVKHYLEELGITSSQVQILSYGKEKPLCIEHNEECWKMNRSVRFVLQ